MFQTYTPYVTGDTRFVWNRELFDTRSDQLRDSQTLQTQLNGRYGGRGYLWRPWFSNLSADLDLNLRHQEAWGDASTSKNFFWDGAFNGQLELVPRSHVPFSANLLYTRDDEQSELLRLRMEQEVKTFNPNAPDYRFSYQYEDRLRRDSENLRHNFISRMYGDTDRHNYAVQLGALLLDNRSVSSRSETETYDFTADHRYDWDSDFYVSEFASAFDSTTDNDTSEIWSGGGQFNVVAAWSPLSSWSANAAVSARQSENSVEDPLGRQDSRETEYTGSAALQYRPSDLFRSSLFSSYSVVERSGQDSIERQDYTADALYTPADISLGEFVYRWDSSARYQVSVVDSVSNDNAEVQLGHQLSRRWGVSESEWVFDASQDVRNQFIEDSHSNSAVELTQRVALTWRGYAESYRDYARLSFTDRRELMGERAESQSIDLNFNRQGELGRFSTWEVNADYQIFRDVDNSGVSSTDDDASSRGRVVLLYTRSNVWGVFNLYYRSELNAQLDYEKDDDSVMRDSNWENALEYRLGRLSAELSVDITEADDGASGTLLFEVRRRWDTR